MRRFLIGIALGLGLTIPAYAQQTKTYQVTVGTANVAYAGTNARVYITLYGPEGPPEGVKLELDSAADDFEPGSVRTYPISTTVNLGGIQGIKLEHDNSSPFPMWHPTGVEIYDPTNGETISFAVNRWLSTESGDRQIEVSMQRADYADWIKKKTLEKFEAPVGRWTVACGGGQNCQALLERSLSVGGSDTETITNDFRSSLEVAISTQFKIAGTGVDTTVTAGIEAGRTEAKRIVNSFSDGAKEGCGTAVDMVKYDIHSVWQWTVSSSISGRPIIIKTCQIACTNTPTPPSFLPNDSASVGTCLKPRGTSGTTVGQPTGGTSFVGTFQTANPTNGYHTGRITTEGSGFRWTNDAGATWGLSADGANRLLTDSANPYKAQGATHFDFFDEGGRKGFRFVGGTYYQK